MKKEMVCVVHGTVQGVAFRVFVRNTALELGLVGTVKNESDGTVMVVAQGEEEVLSTLLTQLRKGPSHAQVTHVDTLWREPARFSSDFAIV